MEHDYVSFTEGVFHPYDDGLRRKTVHIENAQSIRLPEPASVNPFLSIRDKVAMPGHAILSTIELATTTEKRKFAGFAFNPHPFIIIMVNHH
jgi:hypothetical protein